MTVEDLIEELRALPPTALVVVQIRKDTLGGSVEAAVPLYEFREVEIETCVYTRGLALVQLDE